MDRKYRQSGYQDESSERAKTPSPPKDRDGPRSPRMMEFQGTLRCASCGALRQAELVAVQLDEQCAKCSADLRTCRNCVNFDPAARWECRVPITVRVANKSARTECDRFSPRKTVEKKTGETGGGAAPGDARAAFDRLFKR